MDIFIVRALRGLRKKKNKKKEAKSEYMGKIKLYIYGFGLLQQLEHNEVISSYSGFVNVYMYYVPTINYQYIFHSRNMHGCYASYMVMTRAFPFPPKKKKYLDRVIT